MHSITRHIQYMLTHTRSLLLQITAKDAFVGLFIGVQTEWCMFILIYHSCKHTHTHIQTHICTPQTHTYTRTHTHAHIHTHIQTHSHHV